MGPNKSMILRPQDVARSSRTGTVLDVGSGRDRRRAPTL